MGLKVSEVVNLTEENMVATWEVEVVMKEQVSIIPFTIKNLLMKIKNLHFL